MVEIVAKSWWKLLKEFQESYADDQKRTPVLILGDTGTGKEMIAREIHKLECKSEEPFVAKNCALISEERMHPELFGHTKGAFTGATIGRKGCFQEANSGTLFLDEFQELSKSSQASLLRAIEERKVTKLGSHKAEEVSCRIVLATSENPESNNSGMRTDIYYRINEFEIALTPLYSRTTDILVLARHFVDESRTKAKSKKKVLSISGDMLLFLMTWRFPGNVRELKNLINRSIRRSDGLLLEMSGTTKEDLARMLAYQGKISDHPRIFHALKCTVAVSDCQNRLLELPGWSEAMRLLENTMVRGSRMFAYPLSAFPSHHAIRDHVGNISAPKYDSKKIGYADKLADTAFAHGISERMIVSARQFLESDPVQNALMNDLVAGDEVASKQRKLLSHYDLKYEQLINTVHEEYLEYHLQRSSNNVSQAARHMGMPDSTLRKKIKKYLD